ncbi:hypothetical protein BDR06DRAFT_1015459 [Suillus hirtellus]|nr:hypothetical protein BDR06DRAFT_1015459 [Suillus hirtellus]
MLSNGLWLHPAVSDGRKILLAWGAASTTTPPQVTELSSTQATPSSPQKVDFTMWYKKCPTTMKDKLEEYFRSPVEGFETSHDILAIPGSAVAVNHIFSGGCDTISL